MVNGKRFDKKKCIHILYNTPVRQLASLACCNTKLLKLRFLNSALASFLLIRKRASYILFTFVRKWLPMFHSGDCGSRQNALTWQVRVHWIIMINRNTGSIYVQLIGSTGLRRVHLGIGRDNNDLSRILYYC